MVDVLAVAEPHGGVVGNHDVGAHAAHHPDEVAPQLEPGLQHAVLVAEREHAGGEPGGSTLLLGAATLDHRLPRVVRIGGPFVAIGDEAHRDGVALRGPFQRVPPAIVSASSGCAKIVRILFVMALYYKLRCELT